MASSKVLASPASSFLFKKLYLCFLDDVSLFVLFVFRRSRRVLPSCIILILFESLSLHAHGPSVRLFFQGCPPTHVLSQQRSLSICLAVSNTITYRASFDLLPPRARIANGSWGWTSNPFLTIRYASRSRPVSKSRCSFSLLTLVPFSPVKRKKIWIHDASLLSGMVRWLAGILGGIIHQELLLSPPSTKGRSTSLPSIPQSFKSLFTLHFLCFFFARLQPLLSTCTNAVCANRPKGIEIASAIVMFTPL